MSGGGGSGSGSNGNGNSEFDVVVVGYGPVGQLLSLQLGLAGLKVAAVERYGCLYHLARAVHYDHEVARIFQSVSVMADMSAISNPSPANSIFQFTGCEDQVIMQVRYGGAGISGWPEANGFYQPELEQVLDDAVRRLPNVQVLQHHQVQGLEQDAECVELCALDRSPGAGDAVRTLRARYVVGADGANSFVRSRMRTTVTDLDFSFDWLVVNIQYASADVPRLLERQICNHRRPITIAPGGVGRQRLEFMLMPGESREQMGTPETAWALLEPLGVNPGNAILERHAVYTFNARWADSWRDGRVLLAGDAAHVMPPFQAQGMCSGMRDAASLAWRLPMVLRGEAPDTLLDSYGSERINHVRNFTERTLMMGAIICIADPEAAAQRDEMLTAAMNDPTQGPPPFPPLLLGPGLVQDGNPHAGLLSFQGVVEQRGRRGLFDDVVGRGFALVGTSIDPALHLSDRNRRFLDRIGAVVAHVTPHGPLRDVDGGYAAHFAAQGFGVVLTRPDFYQVGATADPAEVDALVDTLRVKLGIEQEVAA